MKTKPWNDKKYENLDAKPMTPSSDKVKENKFLIYLTVFCYFFGALTVAFGFFIAPLWARMIMLGLVFMYKYPHIIGWFEKFQQEEHKKKG